MKILKLTVLFLALLKPVCSSEECGVGSVAVTQQKVFVWVAPTDYHLARLGRVEEKHPYFLLVPSHCDVDKFKKIFENLNWDNFRSADKGNPLFVKVKKVFEDGFDVGLSELEFLPADEVDAILKMIDQNLQKPKDDCKNELAAAHDFLQYLLSPEAKRLQLIK